MFLEVAKLKFYLIFVPEKVKLPGVSEYFVTAPPFVESETVFSFQWKYIE